ncbi:hypothetical protein L2E82_45674 [Cichorium intybus]|uniref:Uncharacterized protein n=1 Tax=Cichorium intybus TaxID=13427 RepID=A0ACB8ZTJ7_CICIN|nr:hypothetical protein L2E82_45674 [Cichorium intybus]
MGKDGGCFPSKNRPPSTVESDPDPAPNPVSNHDDSISIESVNATVEIRKLRIFIVFYSMYGHVESLERSIKKGVEEIDGVEGVLFRVPETLSPETLSAMKLGYGKNRSSPESPPDIVKCFIRPPPGMIFTWISTLKPCDMRTYVTWGKPSSSALHNICYQSNSNDVYCQKHDVTAMVGPAFDSYMLLFS